MQDQKNLNLRKEIEHTERLVAEQKDIQHQNCTQLLNLRDHQMKLDKELDMLHKKIGIHHTEMDNNEQRIQGINNVISSKDESIAQTASRINEAHMTIQDQKY